MKLGIVIGHTLNSPGAINKHLNVKEYSLNLELAAAMHIECKNRNIQSELIYRKNGYSKLPKDINTTGVDFCISVHHNGSSNESANGNETLYYHRSKTSEKFAKYVNDEMFKSLKVRNRGLKPVDSEDRGANVLKNTSMPCILIEPYFITNSEAVAKRDTLSLAKSIINGYEKFLYDK